MKTRRMFGLFLTMFLAVALVLAASGKMAAQTAPGAGAAPVAYGDAISQYGITWIFDQDYEYGQFANGDYWVVGPVTIVQITPDFDGTSHGWQVNPVTGAQGFEEESGDFDAGLVPALPYVASPGESIIKAMSLANTTDCRPCLQTAAVLTVVAEAPPDDGATVFRPPYAGSDKPYYSLDDLRTDLLPAFEPVGEPPTLDWVVERFQRVQLDHVAGRAGRCTRPEDNMPDYAGDIGRDEGQAILRLMLDDPLVDKMPALIAYIQYGIDVHHMILNGQTWPAGGGEQPAHELPHVFAAVMLDDQAMKQGVADAQANLVFYNDYTVGFHQADAALFGHLYELFGEDFGFVEQAYWSSMMGLSGKRTFADPYGYIDGGYDPGQGYDHCCVAQPWKGQVLALHLMPSLKTLWNNEALFDYVDRWVEFGVWTQPDPCAPHDGNWDNYGVTFGPDPGNPGMCILDTDPSDGTGRFPDRHGTGADEGHRATAFIRAMWDAYRYYYTLRLRGVPGDRTIYLTWDVEAALPPTSTWHIDYYTQTTTLPLSQTNIISTARAYTLTGLSNYVWYTITLNAMLGDTPFLSDTVRVMPTDHLVYLPVVLRNR